MTGPANAAAPTRPQRDFGGCLAALGRGALTQAHNIRDAARLLASTARSIPAMETREAVRQSFAMANGSWLFVTVIMSFVGAIMVIQACAQAQRLVGDLSTIGPAFLQLLVREFGPTIVGLMVAARYGAGVAAQLATMTITEQVDAVRVTGTDPVAYLVAPRVIAGPPSMLSVAIWGTAVAYAAGGMAGAYGFGIGWGTYFSMAMVRGADVAIGVAKGLCFGVVVPLWACLCGLSARGGPPGVGQATTRAVIGASVALLACDLLVGLIGFWVFD